MEVTNKQDVKQAGWGLNIHHVNFANGIDAAELSTCMTSELGLLEHRFEHCDLRDLVGNLFSNVAEMFS